MIPHATLCYVVKDDRVLLIKKKRGLGTGKWNAPGGHVKKGEDVKKAAIREMIEEVGIAPINPVYHGLNEFYFGKKEEPAMVVHVFVASEWKGKERETDEAMPKWFSLEDIPYENMWPDDTVWLPLVLAGTKIKGKFYYDDEANELLNHTMEVVE